MAEQGDLAMSMKRSRGRPRGSGLKDDAFLDAVADKMVGDPLLAKTRAIALVVEEKFEETKWEAAKRRLLRKWDMTSRERLAAAKERREERRTVVAALPSQHSLPMFSIRSFFDEFLEPISLQQQFLDIINPPHVRFLRQQDELINQLRGPFDVEAIEVLEPISFK